MEKKFKKPNRLSLPKRINWGQLLIILLCTYIAFFKDPIDPILFL